MEFDETQQFAIIRCLADGFGSRVVAVTGQAGTGKTTILRRVHNGYTERDKSVVLCAPTGKAAKRITEATGIEARTIHRLLEYPHPGQLDPKTGEALNSTYPSRDRDNPIEYDVVLADEYNMVNTEVHRNLFNALPRGGIIRVFGDANQLPPIESNRRLNERPSPFEELLDTFDGIKLTTIHRQEKDSNIILNGDRIIKGFMPWRKDDFTIKITDSPVEFIQDFIMESLDHGIDYASMRCQLITPTHQGWIGTQALNTLLQELLQPSDQQSIDVARHTWAGGDYIRMYKGEKVIQTINNYALGVFNGEMGIISEIDEAGYIVVDLGDDKLITVPPLMEIEGKKGTYFKNPQKDLDLAYAITTHKMQGSECDHVAYVMNRSRPFNLNRKNFYTAVTRARKTVTLITDQKALSLSLFRKDVQVYKRKTQ